MRSGHIRMTGTVSQKRGDPVGPGNGEDLGRSEEKGRGTTSAKGKFGKGQLRPEDRKQNSLTKGHACRALDGHEQRWSGWAAARKRG